MDRLMRPWGLTQLGATRLWLRLQASQCLLARRAGNPHNAQRWLGVLFGNITTWGPQAKEFIEEKRQRLQHSC